jgi:hypothetical protein
MHNTENASRDTRTRAKSYQQLTATRLCLDSLYKIKEIQDRAQKTRKEIKTGNIKRITAPPTTLTSWLEIKQITLLK